MAIYHFIVADASFLSILCVSKLCGFAKKKAV